MRELRLTAVSPDRLAPIQRVRPRPWILRPVQPIAGPNEVVGGGKIVRCIRHDAAPSIAPCARFQRAHQPQLQSVAAMPSQHADPAEISRVEGARRRHRRRQRRPGSPRDRRATSAPDRIPEWTHRQRMSGDEGRPAYPRFRRHVRRPRESCTSASPSKSSPFGGIRASPEASSGFLDFLVGNASCSRPGFHSRLAILGDGLPDHPTGNGMRRKRPQQRGNHHHRTDHFPSMTLMPSHTAPTNPVTITVMTALKV